MKINVAARLKDGQWRAATVVNNNFEDAAVGADLGDVMTSAFTVLFSQSFSEGDVVAIEINTSEPAPTGEGSNG
jgi:hypothetical protein